MQKCVKCGKEFWSKKYSVCIECRPKKKCLVCGVEIVTGKKCQKHSGYNEFTCQYCGETFWQQGKPGEKKYCPLPKMCRYQAKDNEYVEVVDYKSSPYEGDRHTYFVLKCKICGQLHEGRRLESSKTGFSPMCRCISYETYGYTDDGGLKELSDRPRIENKIKLERFETLPKDSSYSIKACMNCRLFETDECGLPDTELSRIEMDEHCCEKFKWYS